MQKKLIALAVAGVASGAAFAQTNVTLYGIADAGYIYSYSDPGKFQLVPGAEYPANSTVKIAGENKFSGITSGLLSGSRIGFRGEEALGNGLKAIFTLEYSINIDDNSGVGNTTTGLNARQQFVGLSHAKLGTVTLGRQYAPGYLATVNNDPLGGALFESQSYLSAQAGMTITPNSGARWNNAVAYATPNWGGFTGKVIYAFGETNNAAAVTADGRFIPAGTYNDKVVDVSDNGRWGLGFNYANGPLNIDIVLQQRQNVVPDPETLYTFGALPPRAAAGDDINEGYIGASYDFKVVKIMGSYQQQNDKNPLNADSDLWSIGAVVPVGNGNIHLGYAQLNMDMGSNKAPYGPLTMVTAAGLAPVKKLNGDSQSATLAYTHNLSKRTTLYAGYVWTDNDKNSIAAGPVQAVAAKGEQNNTFLAGIRHSF
ncbi:MAG: porin [Elusimicrobia bacterium]|nr:MAG: porin [Elusimicrobiota bacterium]